MTKIKQTLILFFALLACLGLSGNVTAQSRATKTSQSSSQQLKRAASSTPTFIDSVVFEGMQALASADVETKFREQRIGLVKEAHFVPGLTKKGAKIVAQMLADVGFMNATVDVRVIDVSANLKRVVFVIAEGPPAVIREILFEGNNVFTDDELRSHLDLITVFSHDVYDRAMLDYDLKNNLRNYMRSRGYLQAKTLEPKVRSTNGNVTIIIPVDEGRLYRIGDISVMDSKEISAEKIVKLLGMEKGDVVDGLRISEVLFDELKELYANLGYPNFSAEPDPEFRDNPDVENEGIVDLKVIINEGTCFKIGTIEFQGNKKLTDQELRRFLHFKEGDTYNLQSLYDSVSDLNDSDLFEPMFFDRDFSLNADEGSQLMSIVIRVQEDKHR